MKTSFTKSVFVAIAIISIAILSNSNLLAQVLPPCGTEKIDSLAAISQLYYNNNQVLIDKADSVEANSCPSCRGLATEAYVVPVHVYIYRNDAGIGGITDERAERLINRMNTFLQNTGVQIRLYLKNEIDRVNNTTYFENINSSGQTTDMFQANHDDNAISIHIIRRNNDNFGGRASFPWKTTRYNFAVITDFADSSPIGDDQMAGIMVHELGHVLGLTHTHESARWSFASNNGQASDCFQESVSRTRTQGIGCTQTFGILKSLINGDMISDTDADPEMDPNPVTGNVTASPGCVYTGGG